jgi:hypothetical protein
VQKMRQASHDPVVAAPCPLLRRVIENEG